MRFCVLGSGSKGNAALIEQGNTRLMVDCGFSARELERRLHRVGCDAGEVSAILLTHEHGDHIRGAAAFSRRHRIPVYASFGTGRNIDDAGVDMRLIDTHEGFSIGDIGVQAYPVPHDAKEPCHYVFDNGDSRIGMVSDLGQVTPHVVEMLHGCEALLVEGNHDLGMLKNGPYPQSLKERVGGPWGHLNNDQAADLLRQVDCDDLSHIVAIHLSKKNNHPDHVVAAFSGALDCTEEWVAVADQETGLGWRDV